MTASHNSAASVVRLPLADEVAARALADRLGECLDPDETVTSVFEQAPGRWTVSVHFRTPPDMDALRGLVAAAGGAPDRLSLETIVPTDWVRQSLAGLSPVEAGRFVVHGAHDRDRIAPNRIAIEIEAALAFGTGHHGTTRGCLLAIEDLAKQSAGGRQAPIRRVLDLGAGTGVLAIAAARTLPRSRVIASDIDPRAVLVARDNARLNRTGTAIRTLRAAGFAARDLQTAAPFDLVLANILLPPLKRLAQPVALALGPRARVVLSGLLPSHTSAALAAYRCVGLRLVRRRDVDGWVTLILARGGEARRPRLSRGRRRS